MLEDHHQKMRYLSLLTQDTSRRNTATHVIDSVFMHLIFSSQFSSTIMSMMHGLVLSIQTMMAMCYDTSRQPLSRVCGSTNYDSRSSVMTQFWDIQVIKHYTVNLNIIIFKLLYSPYCHVDYATITRYELCNVTSKYCGHLPGWNESSQSPRLVITIGVNWPKYESYFLMRYHMSTSPRLLLYQRRFLQPRLKYQFKNLYKQYKVDILFIQTITSVYDRLIKVDLPSDQHERIGNNISRIFDGPGILSEVLHGKISSSFQVSVNKALSINDIRNEFISYTSINTPSCLADNIFYSPASNAMIYYQVLISKATKKSTSRVQLRILDFKVDGFSGLKCEYGGISIINDIFEIIEYGPFCELYPSKTYTNEHLSLPLRNATIIVYWYRRYDNVSTKITILAMQDMIQDVVPLWGEYHLYDLLYLRIDLHQQQQRKFMYISYLYYQTTDQSILYLLPHGTMVHGRSKFVVSLNGRYAQAMYIILSDFNYCETVLKKEIHTSAVITSCPWFEPTLVIEMGTDMFFARDVLKQHSLLPRTPLEIHVQQSICNSTVLFDITTEGRHTFSCLDINHITCQGVLLHISPKYRKNIISHRFLLDNRLDLWLSEYDKLSFSIQFSDIACNCNVIFHHETGKFTWCLHNWFNLHDICETLFIDSSSRLCVKYRCYSLIQGHNTSWLDAEAACQARGGHLVTINSHEELRLVTMLVHKLKLETSEYFFIGMVSVMSQVCFQSVKYSFKQKVCHA